MAENNLPSSLTLGMAKQAQGYGAVIDGILNIKTVTDTANNAALNALYVSGFSVLSACRDPDCDCMIKIAKDLKPGIKIVKVTVEAREI